MTTSREITEKHDDDAARAAKPVALALPSAELLNTVTQDILTTVTQLHRMDASARAHLPLSDYAQLSSIRSVLAAIAGKLKDASKVVDKIEHKEAKIDHRKGNV